MKCHYIFPKNCAESGCHISLIFAPETQIPHNEKPVKSKKAIQDLNCSSHHSSHIKPLKRIILVENSLEVLIPIRPLGFLHMNAVQLRRFTATGDERSEHEVSITRPISPSV